MTDTTTNTAAETATRAGVAKHELIAVANGEHVDITEAVGIRYIDKASGEKFEYLIPNAQPGTPLTMLALFGAKTKATNEASRVRNGENGSTAEQLEAIDEIFAKINSGVWREKAEGGGGTRTDKALLAEVLVAALGTNAKGPALEYQHRLEQEPDYYKKVWGNAAIKAEYNKRAGKTGPAIDTLA